MPSTHPPGYQVDVFIVLTALNGLLAGVIVLLNGETSIGLPLLAGSSVFLFLAGGRMLRNRRQGRPWV